MEDVIGLGAGRIRLHSCFHFFHVSTFVLAATAASAGQMARPASLAIDTAASVDRTSVELAANRRPAWSSTR